MNDPVWYGLGLLVGFIIEELKDRKFKDFFLSVARHSEDIYCICAEDVESQLRGLETVVMGKGYDSRTRGKYERGHMLGEGLDGLGCNACLLREA
jgi:hypothetical protein